MGENKTAQVMQNLINRLDQQDNFETFYHPARGEDMSFGSEYEDLPLKNPNDLKARRLLKREQRQ